MKTILLYTIPVIMLYANDHSLLAQESAAMESLPSSGSWYFTSGSEWIFSTPILDVNGSDKGSIVRFAPVFNAMGLANYDLSSHVGLFGGLSVRNLGFIYDVPDSEFRYKYRTYNAGIPVGFKVGRMHKALFFAGYEIELPFNYKEKRFANERKEDKFNVWLSDRTEPFFQSVFIGFQGPGSSVLSVRYYLTNFHNTDYKETVDGVETMPYAGLNSNILYVSLSFGLFDGSRTIPMMPQRNEEIRDVHTAR